MPTVDSGSYICSTFLVRWADQEVSVGGVPVDDGACPACSDRDWFGRYAHPISPASPSTRCLPRVRSTSCPRGAQLPFRHTVNTFRGCSHACRYCFARPTHEYLDLDAGVDFDSQVVVKLNVAAVLRKELRRRSWTGRRSRWAPIPTLSAGRGPVPADAGVIGALAESATPFSILTKGTLLLGICRCCGRPPAGCR